MRHMDALHRMRKHIVLDGEGASAEARELLLAGYLMVNNGGDLLSSGRGPARDRSGTGIASNSAGLGAGATGGEASGDVTSRTASPC